MDYKEVTDRIEEHMIFHHLAEYPHAVKITEALNLAVALLRTDSDGDEETVFEERASENIIAPIREWPMQPSNIGFEASACRYCWNNPANGGSGICHCILGQNGMVTY